MIRSLYTGLSGILGSQYGMDVTGNNIAGINTLSFKYSRPTFRTVFEQNLYSGNYGNRVGLGSMVSSIDRIMSVGNIENTERTLDMAIAGNGFYMLKGLFRQRTLASGVTTIEKDFISRVGDFRVDPANNIVQGNSGLILMGILSQVDNGEIVLVNDLPDEQTMINAPDKTPYIQNLKPLNLSTLRHMPPKATEKVSLGGILNSESGPQNTVFSHGDYQFRLEFDRAPTQWDSLFTSSHDYQYSLKLIKDGSGIVNPPIPITQGTLTFGPSGSVTHLPGGPIQVEYPAGSYLRSISINDLESDVSFLSPQTFSFVELYDHLGSRHNLSITFEKISSDSYPNRWAYQIGDTVPVDYEDENGVRFSEAFPEQSFFAGVLDFDGSGKLSSHGIMYQDGPAKTIDMSFTPSKIVFPWVKDSETPDTLVAWDLESFVPPLIQMAYHSDIKLTQDKGRTMGELNTETVNVGVNGLIHGSYSNGERAILGRVPLVNIRAPENLMDGSTYGFPNAFEIRTGPTEQDFIGLFRPGEGGTGVVKSFALEMSNVDISREMTNMIKFQRALQLNARSITTADTILDETIRLKR